MHRLTLRYNRTIRPGYATLTAAILLLPGCPVLPPVVNPVDDASIKLERIAAGLTSPIALEQPDDGSGRLFVADQVGLIHVVDNGGKPRDTPFLDIRSRLVALRDFYDERGLLGFALHPSFASNGRLFVLYTAARGTDLPSGFDSETHVSEFRASGNDANLADGDNERLLLRIPQPQANHKGGQLAFGSDGYLYIAVGDGGAANDVGFGHNSTIGNGQDKSTLLGKILRIDVDAGEPYAIPADNPFASDANARPEIWASGLRNPWRFSFDDDGAGNVRLFAGDVGQNLVEEVSVIERGGNYGWNLREGDRCFDPASPDAAPADCASVGPSGERLIDPIITYGHAATSDGVHGISVVGGFLYRGSRVPALRGQYVFGDFSAGFVTGDGRIFAARQNADGTWTSRELLIAGATNGRIGRFIFSFGRDRVGELYVLSSSNLGPIGSGGEVHRIAAAP